MATAKQIAARKLFVKRVKAGEFKRKPAGKKTRAKNPAEKAMTFADLSVGDTFDFVSGTTHDSFYDRCEKTSTRGYVSVDRPDFPKMAVGSVKAKVYHVRRKNPAKKTAIKRAGVPAKKYESRPSQITRAAPTKRLKARRKANVKQGVPGYFPNPALPFRVQQNIAGSGGTGKGWSTVASFAKKSDAITYAKAFAKAALMYTAVRVIDNK